MGRRYKLMRPRDARGIELWGYIDSEGYLVTEERQFLPQGFTEALAAIQERQKPTLVGSTQDHWRLAGSIPQVLFNKKREERGIAPDDWEAKEELKTQMLNDHDYSRLRVWRGRV